MANGKYGVPEHLRQEPRAPEEGEGGRERRIDRERDRETHDDGQLRCPEREGDPAWLVWEQAMVERDVGSEANAEHQRGQLERPPDVKGGRQHSRREEREERDPDPRLEAPPQRVRHRSTLRRNPCAAYRAPASVSAAGYAHCPGAPTSESVRSAPVSEDTVESGASTIQSPPTASPWSPTRRARRRSCWKPFRNPVAQITWSAPSSSAATRKRPSRVARSRGSSHSRPTGYDGLPRARRSRSRSSSPLRWKPARPRRLKSSRGRFRGRRSGSRRRTETTDAPAASAFSHSVAAAIPAPTTSTQSAYPCGWYACTARGSRANSGGSLRPGCPGATRTCGWVPPFAPPVLSSKPPSTARMRSIRRRWKLSSHPDRSRTSATCSRNSSTVGW